MYPCWKPLVLNLVTQSLVVVKGEITDEQGGPTQRDPRIDVHFIGISNKLLEQWISINGSLSAHRLPIVS